MKRAGTIAATAAATVTLLAWLSGRSSAKAIQAVGETYRAAYGSGKVRELQAEVDRWGSATAWREAWRIREIWAARARLYRLAGALLATAAALALVASWLLP